MANGLFQKTVKIFFVAANIIAESSLQSPGVMLLMSARSNALPLRISNNIGEKVIMVYMFCHYSALLLYGIYTVKCLAHFTIQNDVYRIYQDIRK